MRARLEGMGKIFNSQVGFDRWNRGTEWAMAIVSLVFIGVYAYVVRYPAAFGY